VKVKVQRSKVAGMMTASMAILMVRGVYKQLIEIEQGGYGLSMGNKWRGQV